MNYLLLLIIFWKPLYWLVMYAVSKAADDIYITKIKDWFLSLWNIISPTGLK